MFQKLLFVFTAQAHSFGFPHLSDVEYQLLKGWEVIVVFANAVIKVPEESVGGI